MPLWIGQGKQDLRYACRSLAKRPAFALAAIATFALGIGANTAIFSIVDTVILRPLPYADPDSLVRIWSANPRGIPRNSVSPPDFFDLREQAVGGHAFEALAAFTADDTSTLRDEREPARALTSEVSPGLFDMLGVKPALGRPILPSDARDGAADVLILSDRLWRTRFGARADIVGTTLGRNGKPATVIGVMPTSFAFPNADVELWVPLNDSVRAFPRAARSIQVVGRLAPGISQPAAHEVLRTVAARLERQYPDTNRGWGVTLATLYESVIGDVRRPLLVLLAAVGCVLLIACANVASLLLARGASRSREIALRSALGASPGRVACEQLVESGLIASFGGAAGLLIGWWGVKALLSIATIHVPRLEDAALDARLLTVTLVLSLVTGLVTGLSPALRAAATNPNDLLKSTQGSGVSRSGRRSRTVLVTAEIALSLALLIVAGLLVQSFARLTSVDTGFRADHVLLAQVSLPASGYPPDRWPQFFDRALGEIRALPGVDVAGAGAPLPLSGQRGLLRFGVRFEGRPEPAEGQNDRTYLRWVTPDYFRAMGIPVLQGRAFSDADRPDTTAVAVIDQSFADRYFPGESPIGKRARTTNSRTLRAIVGIVGNVRQTSLDEPPEPHFYVAHTQSPSPVMTFVVRALVEPAGLSPAVRQAIRRVDPAQAIYNVRTLAEVTSGSAASQRFNASLLALFAALAVTLTLVGVYGLTAYWVSESTREIGVRVALGASRHEVMRMVLGRGLRVSAAGAALGVLIGLAAAQFLGGLLYGLTPIDVPTFAVATILVMGASMTASYLPARRALAIDPTESLRE